MLDAAKTSLPLGLLAPFAERLKTWMLTSEERLQRAEQKILEGIKTKVAGIKKVCVILLMEEILHHLGCIKPCELWDIHHINWFAGFLPSTV